MIATASAIPCIAAAAVVIDRAARPYTPSRAWGARATRESADCRNRWRAVLARVSETLGLIVIRDGERSPVPLDLRHDLATVGAEGFPVEGATAQVVATVLRDLFAALIDASLPRRRVAIAIALKGVVDALEALIDDQQTLDAKAWRGRPGGDA
jgi:hypothetical protein